MFDGKVVIPRMSDTVYLITGLVPDTKYEVKARMYSNAGNGPFSELFVVKTDTGECDSLGDDFFFSDFVIVISIITVVIIIITTIIYVIFIQISLL